MRTIENAEIIDRLDRIIAILDEIQNAQIATELKAGKPDPCHFGHQWNWMGGGRTFCRRCGLETHP